MELDVDRLSLQDFRRLANFIEAYSGIRMPPTKKTMVEGRLRRRARVLGLGSLDAYCRQLFEGGLLAREAVRLIDAVTTNKTEFFREPGHFDFLVEQALPRLLDHSAPPALHRPIKIWSAACSSGAEPYTLAMVLDDFAAKVRGFHFSILATDICTEVLARATTAIYPEDMMDPVPAEFRRRYVMKSRDRSQRSVRMVAPLRAMVQFGRLNLMDDQYPVDTDMDVIFCRNILIYFDKPTQEAVVERLCRHLRPGGYLFVGHTESVAGFCLPLKPVSSSVFVHR